MGKKEEAIADFTQALIHDPKQLDALFNRGLLYADMNNREQAIKDFTAVIIQLPNDFETIIERGDAYLALKKFDDALKDYTLALKASPKNANALASRGLCYSKMGKEEQALKDFNEAVTSDPGSFYSLSARGDFYLSHNKYALAISDFSEALKINPMAFEPRNNRGNAYYYTNKYDMAVSDYSMAILLDSTIYSVYFNRGNAYNFLERYAEAMADYNKAITLNSTTAGLWVARAELHDKLYNYEQALSDYEEVLRINPADTNTLNNRGLIYLELNKPIPALKDFNEALNINPGFRMALINRGNAYISLGKYELARKDFNGILQRDPLCQEAWDSRGNTYYYKNAYDSAIADYNKVLKINPRNTNALINRGNTYLAQGKRKEALEDYRLVIKLEPKKLSGWFNIANAFIKTYQYDSAIRYSNEALRYNSRYTPALNSRATANYYLGNITAAEKDVLQSLRISPRSPIALNLLGMVCTQRSMQDSSLNAYNLALMIDPNFADALNNRGLFLYNTNKYKEAIADYQKAMSLQPKNSRLVINLVLAYIASEQFGKAQVLYKQYKDKENPAYIDEWSNYRFLKNYIIACTDFIASNDYNKALPLLQESLDDYKLVNPGQGSNSLLSLEYSNVLYRTGWTFEKTGQGEKALTYYRKAALINSQLNGLTDKISSLTREVNEKKMAANAAPVIKLLTPEVIKDSTVSGELSAKAVLFVSGVVNDLTGISWVKINGRNASILNEDGYFAIDVNEYTGNLTIQAQNKLGKVSTLSYQYSPATDVGAKNNPLLIPPIPPAVNPGFHAVLIACSDYTGEQWAKLPNTIAEAKEYKKILMSDYGFKEENIVEIYDKGQADIIAGLNAKMQTLTPNDNLVILFAGHGTYKNTGNQLIGYWVPLNTTKPWIDYISNGKLDELVYDCQARHILILSDACYSAAMRSGDDRREMPQLPKNKEYNFKSRQILTSGGLEKVPEKSVFISMLLKSLQGNEEKFISVKMLYNLIFNGVRNQTGKEPELNLFGKEGNEGGQFYFVRSK